MNEIELQALFIRHEAAVKQLDGLNGYEMLAHVMLPSPAVLAASLQVANERGPSKMAIALARTENQEDSAREGQRPTRAAP